VKSVYNDSSDIRALAAVTDFIEPTYLTFHNDWDADDRDDC